MTTFYIVLAAWFSLAVGWIAAWTGRPANGLQDEAIPDRIASTERRKDHP